MRLLASLTLLAMASATQAQVPPPSTAPVPKGAYSLDKSHASLIFRVDHLGFSTFTGRFTSYEASLNFDPEQLASSSVNVTIDPRSITSDNAPEGFVATMAGKELLDAAQFPEMKFVSKSIDVSGRNLRINGELTLRGVTKPIVLEARTTAVTQGIRTIRRRASASRPGARSSARTSASHMACRRPAAALAWAMKCRWCSRPSSPARR
jgi:polyisoprenoid-binding protein YceI